MLEKRLAQWYAADAGAEEALLAADPYERETIFYRQLVGNLQGRGS